MKRKKKKMLTKELEPAPSKVAPSDPSLSESKKVLIPHTQVVPESEMTQALLEASSMIVPKGGSFDDVAREALKVAEEIFHKGGSSAMSNPLVA